MNDYLSYISKASTHLLNEENINDALNFCLADIGMEQTIDRCYIYKNVEDNGIIKLLHSYGWCKEDTGINNCNTGFNGLSHENLPELFSAFSSDETACGLVEDSNNVVFKEIMSVNNVRSYLLTPIYSDRILWGCIGFDIIKTDRKWNIYEISAIRTVAKNIGLRLNKERILSKLEMATKKFDYCLQSSNQSVWELDIYNTKAVISSNWAGMLGFSNGSKESFSDFWIEYVHFDEKPRLLYELEHFIYGKINKFEGIAKILHEEGYYRWVKYVGILEYDEKKNPIHIIGTLIDVNELKEKEEQLKISEEKFRFIAENSTDLIGQHELDGTFKYVSPSSLDILGYTPQELLNKLPLDFIHENDLQDIQNYLEAICQNKQSGVITFRFRRKNGFYVWLETTTKIIVDHENKVSGFQTSSRDISERVNATKEINASLMKERKFNELKSKFVAMASHQFRTPLTVIYSNSELLEIIINKFDKNANHNLTPILTRIKNEVDRMTELMDNILIFGKYESKQIDKKIQPLCFLNLIDTLITTYFDNNSCNRKIDIQIIGASKIFQTDETLITHILTNAINNAFKYSVGKANPLLTITYQQNEIEIKITDYGIGIPQNEIQYLFTSFFRASNTSTIIGSGLGLTIVKQFTEFLHGTVEIESKENYGTTIILTFPYEQ